MSLDSRLSLAAIAAHLHSTASLIDAALAVPAAPGVGHGYGDAPGSGSPIPPPPPPPPSPPSPPCNCPDPCANAPSGVLLTCEDGVTGTTPAPPNPLTTSMVLILSKDTGTWEWASWPPG